MTPEQAVPVAPTGSNADSLKDVTEGGYCIGCGACALADPDIRIIETSHGLYQAELPSDIGQNVAAVCPFSAAQDETEIAQQAFASESDADALHYDHRVGYFRQICAGHVAEDNYRKHASSGGLVTWVLTRLLERDLIDGVIHVGATGKAGHLFQYRISDTPDQVRANAKSRYYPVHMDQVLARIRGDGKRYALVGVPCFIKASRLLAQQDEQINSAIAFRIAIFCGHMKSKAYAEMIGWQLQVPPDQLTGIDFRVKDPARPANLYLTEVASGLVRSSASIRQLWGLDWGVGLFKPKACDWCDDIAGETADLTCGDAWLPEFVGQPQGSNIVVVRHDDISRLLEEGIESGSLQLSPQTADQVYQSQAANYRHRVEGLAYRVRFAQDEGRWHPKKRVAAQPLPLSPQRERIYRIRQQMSEQSHPAFYTARQQQSLLPFVWRMLPLELRYYRENGQLIKATLKKLYQLSLQLFRKYL